MKARIIILLLASVIFILIAAQCSSNSPTSTPQPPANTQSSGPQLDGKTLVQNTCTACHTLQRATSFNGNATQWKSVVDDMIRRGAQINTDQEQAIVNYMAQTYP